MADKLNLITLLEHLTALSFQEGAPFRQTNKNEQYRDKNCVNVGRGAVVTCVGAIKSKVFYYNEGLK